MKFFERSELTKRLDGSVVISETTLMMALLFACLSPGAAGAQSTAQDKNPQSATETQLPAGKQVMEQYIERTGGQQAYDRIRNRVTEATLEIVGQGVSIDMTTWAARPNKIKVKIESELTGKIEKGCDGKVVWENSLVSGPVVHEGGQRANGLLDSTFERFVYWDTIYDSAECVGTDKVGDAECYEIVLNPPKSSAGNTEGSPVKLYIDKDSYLIRKFQTEVLTDAGKIKVEAFPEDYREIDGIKLPHKTRMNLLGQNRLITLTSVKHNVDLPDSQFDLPADVRELVK